MQQYFEFVSHHPFLCGGFIAVLIVLLLTEWNNSRSGAKNLNILQGTQLMNNPQTVLLDVRPNADFKKGHLQNAKNIALSTLKPQLDNVCQDKSAPLLVYCNIGMTAKTAAKMLQNAGYSNVHLLKGGISAWQAENMPVVK